MRSRKRQRRQPKPSLTLPRRSALEAIGNVVLFFVVGEKTGMPNPH
jgi:hypothetical protein